MYKKNVLHPNVYPGKYFLREIDINRTSQKIKMNVIRRLDSHEFHMNSITRFIFSVQMKIM